MRVDIFGTGALAMLYGARLAAAGIQVELSGTWEAGLRAIHHAGIRVEDRSGSWVARVGTRRLSRFAATAQEGAHRRPPAELALVLVKSYQTPAVAAHLAARPAPPLRARGSLILTLQNGLTAGPLLSVAAPGRTVARGVTTRAARVLGPGSVRDAGGGSTLLPISQRRVGHLLERAGFAVRTVSDIDSEIWRKVAVSCAINPLTALEGVQNGALLERAAWRRVMQRAAEEVGRVAAAHGVALAEEPAAAAFRVARATATNRSSMLQDLDRGARTEIDALCGAVVTAGRRAGVATPVNLDLWRRVSCREGRPLASPRPQATAAGAKPRGRSQGGSEGRQEVRP
jgi:2-dehydropantoate 2-reductase